MFDEAHYLKNHTSARSRVARQLAEHGDDPRDGDRSAEPAVYLLTGTPLTNRPRDLFVLLQLVGHPLGRSFLSFAKRYCAAEKNDFGWKTDGASNLEELTVQLHGVMLRRTKDQVLALPPKLRTWLPVEVPAGTGAREIREVVDLLLRSDRPGRRGAAGEGQGRDRMQLLAQLTKARQQLAVAKADATIDFVSGAVEQGEKVIVFSCFDEPLQAFAKAFGDQAVLLTGRTPVNKRQALVDRFQQDDGVRVFLANIIAGGVGLNLTAASQVVFNDLDWVPANHWQAEDRAYRIGQTRTVNVTYLVGTDTVDDFVQAVLETKGALVNAVVEGGAMAGDLSGSVLDELERALRAISPGLADAPRRIEDDDADRAAAAGGVREAADHGRARRRSRGAVRRPGGDRRAPARARGAVARAVGTVSDALSDRQHVAARRRVRDHGGRRGRRVQLPGLRVSRACRHARDVKAALAGGRPVPAAYVREAGAQARRS